MVILFLRKVIFLEMNKCFLVPDSSEFLSEEDFDSLDFSKICEYLSFCDYDFLGKVIHDAFFHEDNSFHELGKSLISVFLDCHSEDEFDFKNEVLMALTGYNLQDFLLHF